MKFYAVKIAALCWMLFMSVTDSHAEASGPHGQLHISLDREAFAQGGKLLINGKLGVFVNCGSQLSIWASFPQDVQFKVTDLQTGKQYVSGRGPESISYHQSTIASYAKMPCNQIVEEEFVVDLANNLWMPQLPHVIGAIKIEAEYLSIKSNELSIPWLEK